MVGCPYVVCQAAVGSFVAGWGGRGCCCGSWRAGAGCGGGPGGDGPPEAASCSSQGPTTASRAGWDLGVQAPDPVGGLVDLAGQVQVEAGQHAQRYGLLRGANGSQGVGMVLAAPAMASGQRFVASTARAGSPR